MNGEIFEDNLEMVGGENGMIPEIYKVFSGDSCSYLEEKKAGETMVIAKKCIKTDLM